MAPEARDKVKNAWPMAASRPSLESLPSSKVNKKRRAWPKPPEKIVEAPAHVRTAFPAREP